MQRTTVKWMRESRLPYMVDVAAQAGVDASDWTFGQHFGLMWTLVDGDMNRFGAWETLGEAERGTDAMIAAWRAVIDAKKGS